MALTSTNALVAIAVGAASPVNQVPNGSIGATSGQVLTFSLQSTALVQSWTLSIFCDDLALNGLVFTWNPGQQNRISFTTPAASYNMTYQSLVSDGTSSIAFVLGRVKSAGLQLTPPGLKGQSPIANGDGTFTPAGVSTVNNCRSFGCVADSLTMGTDNAPFINAAIQAAITSNQTTVLLPFDPINPNGSYEHNSPIYINASLRFSGEHNALPIGSRYVRLSQNAYEGPQLIIGKDIPDVTYNTRTYAGTTIYTATLTNSVPGAFGTGTYINFSTCSPGGMLNGLANFTASFYIDPLSSDPGGGVANLLVSRGGEDSAGVAQQGAMHIFLTSANGTTNEVGFTLVTNNGAFTAQTHLTSPFGLAANTLQHIYCQLDGVNNLMTIIVDGVLRAKTTVTGGSTITQFRAEEFCLGMEIVAVPEAIFGTSVGGPKQMGGIQCRTDVVHAVTAGTALGTSIFTDTGGQPVPGLTAPITLDFDPKWRSINVSGHTGWIENQGIHLGQWYRWHGTKGADYMPQVEIDHLTLSGSNPIYTTGMINSSIHHMNISCSNSALTLDEFSFQNHIHDLVIVTTDNVGYRNACIVNLFGCQFNHYGPDINLVGGTYLVMTNQETYFQDVWCTPDSVGCYYIGGGGAIADATFATTMLENCFCSDDNGKALTLCGIKGYGQRILVRGGYMIVGENGFIPVFIGDHCEFEAENCVLGSGNGAPFMVQRVGTDWVTPRPWKLPPTQWSGLTNPWIDPANATLVTVGSQRVVGTRTVNFPSDANLSVAVNDSLWYRIEVTSTGNLTATRQLIMPFHAKDQVWRVHNNTQGAQSITVIGTTGTGVTIANGVFAEVYDNGTNLVAA